MAVNKGRIMRMKIVFLAIMVLVNPNLHQSGTVFAAVGPGEPGDIQELSLKEVQAYAVKHSTATQNARLDVAMAKKKIWETTAAGLPQVSASASYMNNLQIPTTLIPAGGNKEVQSHGLFPPPSHWASALAVALMMASEVMVAPVHASISLTLWRSTIFCGVSVIAE